MSKRGASVVAACPVCQAGLADMSSGAAELHVNGCLDVALLEDRKRVRRAKRATDPPPVRKAEPKLPAAHGVKAEPVGGTVLQRSGLSAKEMLREIEADALDVKPTQALSTAQEAAGEAVEEPEPAVGGRARRPLPDYKRMPHTTFTVDAFQYGRLGFCTGYFLSHFHSDHYGGLGAGFAGELYCSRITANCMRDRLRVDPRRIHALPTGTRCLVQGVYVTLVDANHCPGAVILLLEVPHDGRLLRIVHTGDFRATRAHIAQILCVFGRDVRLPVTPAVLAAAVESSAEEPAHRSPLIDYVYLDTTYMHPGYSFPKQDDVVRAVVDLCAQAHADPEFLLALLQRARRPNSSSGSGGMQSSGGDKQASASLITRWFRRRVVAAEPRQTARRTLFVVGSYTLGKERLFVEIALRLGSRIYVTSDKLRMLRAVGSPSLLALLTTDMGSAQVHVAPLGHITLQRMAEYLAAAQATGAPFSRIVAFKPTGWSHAGPGFGARALPLPAPPQPPAAADADRAWAEGGAAGLAAALAGAARMDGWDGSGGDCWPGAAGLRPHGAAAKVVVFPVPYSEHSSFGELAAFVCSLKARHVVPTVPAAGGQDHLAARWLQHWQDLNAEFERRAADCPPAPAVGWHPVLGLAARAANAGCAQLAQKVHTANGGGLPAPPGAGRQLCWLPKEDV
ncbi:repair protein PSO2 SNM1 [Coemansia nantahalensis]|nr:repair protein PSO2 SNM1 [Coemansia nantahalensis]